MTATDLAGAGRNESVFRAFDVMRAIAASRGLGVATAELVAQTGIPRSTVLRVLGSLAELGAVSRLSDRSWVIGPTVGDLAAGASPIVRLRDLVHQQLVAVTDTVRETSMIAIPVGDAAMRVLDEVEGPQLLGVRSRWSARVIDYSASGAVRALLAESPSEVVRARLERMDHPRRTPFTRTSVDDLVAAVDEIRTRGYSAVVNELEDGIAGVGVPVRHRGGFVAELAVYLPTTRFTAGTRRLILNELRRAGGVIEQAIASE